MENEKVVFGVFKTRLATDRAVESLKTDGFANSEISVLLPNQTEVFEDNMYVNSKAPEGAATGAGAGAIIGGALGLLAGVGALALPGVGALMAAGPIMAALAGVGVGGVIGGVSGALIGLGLPEYEARRYEDSVKNGGILLSVHTDEDHVADAKRSLEVNGAVDIAVAPNAAPAISFDVPENYKTQMPADNYTDTYRPIL